MFEAIKNILLEAICQLAIVIDTTAPDTERRALKVSKQITKILGEVTGKRLYVEVSKNGMLTIKDAETDTVLYCRELYPYSIDFFKPEEFPTVISDEEEVEEKTPVFSHALWKEKDTGIDSGNGYNYS